MTAELLGRLRYWLDRVGDTDLPGMVLSGDDARDLADVLAACLGELQEEP